MLSSAACFPFQVCLLRPILPLQVEYELAHSNVPTLDYPYCTPQKRHHTLLVYTYSLQRFRHLPPTPITLIRLAERSCGISNSMIVSIFMFINYMFEKTSILICHSYVRFNYINAPSIIQISLRTIIKCPRCDAYDFPIFIN